jgi:hypothetical protein
MATEFFFTKDDEEEINIEPEFGIRIMSVRGLNPPNPKELYTRDWAAENGVDYYVPTSRKRKSSEILMTLWIEDGVKTALVKYAEFCAYVFDGVITYRDNLQGQTATLLYQENKPVWYQFVGVGQIMAEMTFLNPSGAVTTYVAP